MYAPLPDILAVLSELEDDNDVQKATTKYACMYSVICLMLNTLNAGFI